MSLIRTVDWHHEAIAYLRWSLAWGRRLGEEVVKITPLERGDVVAYVPPSRDVSSFLDGVGSSTAHCTDGIAEVCASFLATPGRVVMFENPVLKLDDPRGFLPGRVGLTDNSVVNFALSGATRSALALMVREWDYEPAFNAFLSDIGEEKVSLLRRAVDGGVIDVAEIVTGLCGVICGAYDGEGFVTWWKEGFRLTAHHDSSRDAGSANQRKPWLERRYPG